jgi:uncharacterized protein (TIGR03086 family)
VTERAERYRRIASAFTARVVAVPPDAWDRPAPCEGWRARDVVGHLVEWIPAFFFATWDIDAPVFPSAADDPVAAWTAFDRTVQAALDDPEVAARERTTRMGDARFDATFDMIATNDVFLHTWDLARATGLDERLDPDEVHALLVAMEPLDAVLRESGHYGPRTEVPPDADEQTRLLAFIGRRP